MKKKFLSFILALCLIIPATFMFTACSTTEDDNVQIRVQDGYVQWSSNDSDWKNVITIDEILDAIGDDITGPQGEQGVNGKQVEFSVSATHIQWRYVGDSTWNNLVALTELKGDKGDDGENSSVAEYTITYDYNTTLNVEELMSNYKTSQTVKSNEWVLNMPSLDNEEFDDYFLGWYIKNTDKRVEDYDFIGGNVTLQARWNDKYYLNCSKTSITDDGYIFAIDTSKALVIVPEIYNDGSNGEKNVVGVAHKTTSENNLEQIILPTSLKSIGQQAFDGCSKLKEIIIPNSVEFIDTWAFKNCSSLSEIVIPNSVKTLSSYAFQGCSNVENITLGTGLTTIEDSVFDDTEFYKTEDNWTNNVLYINHYLIKQKSNSDLGNYQVIDGTVLIAENAFDLRIKSVEIPASCKYINNSAFYGSNLESVILNEGILNIGYSAFEATKIESVNIPASVEFIDELAFGRCSNLTSIIVNSNNTIYDSRENCNAIIISESNTLLNAVKTQ